MPLLGPAEVDEPKVMPGRGGGGAEGGGGGGPVGSGGGADVGGGGGAVVSLVNPPVSCPL